MPFTPASNDEVSQFLRSRSKSSLHISGEEKDYGVIETISLSKLNSVLLYEPEEMIISVQAGISLQDFQSILASKGQWIPTLVAGESLERTLGATVARDHFNPRSLNCGALRTTILGGTFCTTKGEIFKSGSRVVKSVAGYDIHRAFCGSQGLFGIILELTLKVQPLPEMFYRFFANIKDREKLLRFHPICLEEFSGKLLVELSGYKEDITFDIDQLQSGKMLVEEVIESEWTGAIKQLIQSHKSGKTNSFDLQQNELLAKVRSVFDPDGILI